MNPIYIKDTHMLIEQIVIYNLVLKRIPRLPDLSWYTSYLAHPATPIHSIGVIEL